MQKLGLTKVVFKGKVLSDFDFGDFWRNWLQSHLVGKVLKLLNSPRHYQYLSLVCKTHSKSQEELSDTFFLLKWTLNFVWQSNILSFNLRYTSYVFLEVFGWTYWDSCLKAMIRIGLMILKEFCFFFSKKIWGRMTIA